MIVLHRLGPGACPPAWVRDLDNAVFRDAWGGLDSNEVLWTLPGQAFARWRWVPSLGEAELLRIAVVPERRGQGLGGALLKGCVQELLKEGCRECFLEVRASNASARALYEGAGWQETGRRRGYYSDGEDAVLYRLQSRVHP